VKKGTQDLSGSGRDQTRIIVNKYGVKSCIVVRIEGLLD
jgi:hypothetical protein